MYVYLAAGQRWQGVEVANESCVEVGVVVGVGVGVGVAGEGCVVVGVGVGVAGEGCVVVEVAGESWVGVGVLARVVWWWRWLVRVEWCFSCTF